MISSTWRYPADAYKWLLSTIAANGDLMKTEDGKLCREVCNLAVTIQEPMAGYPLPGSGWDLPALDRYAEQLLSEEGNGFDYTYGERLTTYPDTQGRYVVDQIDYCISKLRKSPNTRRAMAITWIPVHDTLSENVPCLQIVDFLLRGGKLSLTAFFRSWDVARAAPANMYGLGRLLQHVGDGVGYLPGSLTIVAASGHVYEV